MACKVYKAEYSLGDSMIRQLTKHYYEAKHDRDKSRVDLVTPEFILGIGMVMKYGAEKYGEGTWKDLPDAEKRYYGATLRHLLQSKQGEARDRESGIDHLLHAAANIMMLYYCKTHGNNKELAKDLEFLFQGKQCKCKGEQ